MGKGLIFGMNNHLQMPVPERLRGPLKYKIMNKLTLIEVCVKAGGQTLGLELAGFKHEAAIAIDKKHLQRFI